MVESAFLMKNISQGKKSRSLNFTPSRLSLKKERKKYFFPDFLDAHQTWKKIQDFPIFWQNFRHIPKAKYSGQILGFSGRSTPSCISHECRKRQ